jgi:putative nucleotidyltransferase with HDIG domain
MSLDLLRWPAYRPDPAALRSAGFSALAVVGVAIVYKSTSHSLALATAAVVAASTAAGMHARLAIGRSRAAMQIVACAALLSGMGALLRLAGDVLVTGLAGAELIARCTSRSALVRVGMWTGALGGIVTVSGLMAAVPETVGEALREAAAAAAGGFAAAPLSLTLGPIAERLFGHITRWTLSEWLSFEHPLLRELAATASGTFQHSVNVGVLADSAATAIGGDALLARVGGLYHDVGKTRAPQYFIENQHGPNPHDDLQPWDSARILRAHVSNGVDLVEQHRMGSRVAAFVREHHGTGLMRLFYDKAAALSSSGTTEETYRYPGPRPRSRETAIVMIADQVEATARSSPPADDAACDEIVRRTLERIQAEGQLAESGLTQCELSQVHRGLSRALQAMYHRRLPYPTPGAPSQHNARVPLTARMLRRRRTGSS